MKQKQEEPKTALEQIRDVWKHWDVSCNVPIWDAMDDIGKILAEDEKREERLKTISEDAKRDRVRRETGL